jgi:hypothetical protein
MASRRTLVVIIAIFATLGLIIVKAMNKLYFTRPINTPQPF